MKTNEESAEKIWIAYFGNVQETKDAFGTTILRNMHGQNGQGSWEVDHIWPEHPTDRAEGANTFSNIQPLATENNRAKKNFLQGKINNVSFSVHKTRTSGLGTSGRMAILKNGVWYWGYNEPKF